MSCFTSTAFMCGEARERANPKANAIAENRRKTSCRNTGLAYDPARVTTQLEGKTFRLDLGIDVLGTNVIAASLAWAPGGGVA